MWPQLPFPGHRRLSRPGITLGTLSMARTLNTAGSDSWQRWRKCSREAFTKAATPASKLPLHLNHPKLHFHASFALLPPPHPPFQPLIKILLRRFPQQSSFKMHFSWIYYPPPSSSRSCISFRSSLQGEKDQIILGRYAMTIWKRRLFMDFLGA